MDNKKNNSDNKDLKNINEIKGFYGNSTLSFIHKKSEKISSATYLITNHLSENEPIKWSVREASLAVVKDIFSLPNNFSNSLFVFDNLKNKIYKLISILDILSTTGLISQMNHKILKDEIVNLSTFIEPKYDLVRSPDSNFNQEFFYVAGVEPKEKEEIDVTSSLSNKNTDRYFSKEKESLKDIYKGQVYKRHMSFINKGENVSDKNYQGQDKNQGSKRKQAIIKIIKDKEQVTVKDLSTLIKDFSEKTLQRDLLSLVRAGVLKKEGERRWSRYSIA